jgi:hypothetical protein
MAERMTVRELGELLGADRAVAEGIRREYRTLLDAPLEWLTPEEAARTLEISTRQLRNLEERGLPFRGEQSQKRYAYPLCHDWYQVWRQRAATRRGYAGEQRLDALAAFRLRREETALSRAYWSLLRPDLYSGELDPHAQSKLGVARALIAQRRTPDGNRLPDPADRAQVPDRRPA